MIEGEMIGTCRACKRQMHMGQDIYSNSVHLACLREEQFRISNKLCVYCKEPYMERPLRFEGADGNIAPNQLNNCGKCDILKPSGYPDHE